MTRGRIIDLTGQRFGRLLVIKQAGFTVHRSVRWLCRCDCGKETTVASGNLRWSNTKSCGCSSFRAYGGEVLWDFGENTTLSRIVLKSYLDGAKKRKLTWELPQEVFFNLIRGACHYCGAVKTNTRTHRGKSFSYNGIDRVDSGIGYTPENTVSCCAICNNAKKDMPLKDFLSWIRRVAVTTSTLKENT